MNIQNITMVSGDSKVLSVTVTLPDCSVMDLTGASVIWVLATRRNSATVLVTKTSDDNSEILINAPTLGELKIMLDPVDTATRRGTFWHECQITDAENNVSTVFGGNFSILDDVAP